MQQPEKGIDNDKSTQQIYLSFCLTHFLLIVPHIIPVSWFNTIQGWISQMKEVCTKPDIHNYAADLLNEGTEDC